MKRSITSPVPYNYADSVTVSDFLLSWGWILKNLAVKGGARILEYGAGEAQLSMQLARMGCDVAIVDIDERYLDAVQAQCDTLGVKMQLQKGQFGDHVGDRLFDRIVFFEAFHHAFDHPDVLDKLAPLLADNGFILFAGEPIVDVGNPFVPFAWGPRLDGISVRSTRKFGWCELGFQKPYFVERLMRSGYLVECIPCPLTGRGDCYTARPMPMNTDIRMAAQHSIETHGSDSNWHPAEPTHRWTGPHALFPIPQERVKSVVVTVMNYFPVDRVAELRCGADTSRRIILAGQRGSITVKASGARLEILAEGLRPADVMPDSVDERVLGMAVETIRLQTDV